MVPLRINWILPRPDLSGGAKSNRLIAEAMVRRGHDVRMAYVAKPRPMPSIRSPRVWTRAALERLRSWLSKPQHHLLTSTARLIPVDRQLIQADDVPDADVTIGTWWKTMEWIAEWPSSKGIKAHFVRGYEVFGGDPERVKAVYRMPFLRFVIATWLQRLIADEFNDPNAILIPNGVDWAQFNSVPRGKAPVPTVGLLYGSMRIKGADIAFEAIRLAQKQIPTLRVVSFGHCRIHRGHRPPARFEYEYRPDQARIPEIYRSADCWLIPSRTEGFGMPGLEAAACRCPVIATRSGGPEDYVRHGESGYLVDVDDVCEMAERMVQVVTTPADRWRLMSEASYRIAHQFDWDRSAEKLEQALYNRLCQ